MYCSNERPYLITSSASASKVGGHLEAKRPCGLEVDHELELGRLLDCETPRRPESRHLLTGKDIASSAASARRPCA
jgi:hypothetical protein